MDVKNPRIEPDSEEFYNLFEIAKSGVVPAHDEKNDGETEADFLEVLDIASKDSADIGTYIDVFDSNGRATYAK